MLAGNLANRCVFCNGNVSRPDGSSVPIATNHDGLAYRVTQYGNGFEAINAGDAASELLSDWLNLHVRLVRTGAGAHR